MDKQDNREVLIDIKRAYENGDYERVVMYSRDLVLAKIRENSILEMISDSYDALGRADIARDVLLTAYERTPMGRKMAFKLSELSVKLNDLDNAVEFYEDFCRMAPHDSDRYILKYEIGRTAGVPAKDLIKVLENYCAKEMDDRWMYELASLYHDQNEGDKCAAICDDIILYFNDGEYVKKALELKNAHKALTPSQQERYEAMMHNYMGNNPVSFVDEKQKKEEEEVTDLADLFLANMKLEERTAFEEQAAMPAPDPMKDQIEEQLHRPIPRPLSAVKPQLNENRFDSMALNHPAVREEAKRSVTPVADPAFVQQAYDEPEYIQPEVLKEQFFGEKKEVPKDSIWDKPINFDNPAEPEKASFVDYRIESPILDEINANRAVPDEAFSTWRQPVENKIRPELNTEDAELFEPAPKEPEPTHGSFYQEVVEKPVQQQMKDQVPLPVSKPVSEMAVGNEVDYFEKQASKAGAIAGLSAMAGLVVKPALKGAAGSHGMSFQKPVKTYNADPSEEIEIVSKRKVEVDPSDSYGTLKAAAASAAVASAAVASAAAGAEAERMKFEEPVYDAPVFKADEFEEPVFEEPELEPEREDNSEFYAEGTKTNRATFGMPKFVSVVEQNKKSEDIYNAHLGPSETVVLSQFDEDMDNVEGQISLTSMFDTYSLHMEEVLNPISKRTPMTPEEKLEESIKEEPHVFVPEDHLDLGLTAEPEEKEDQTASKGGIGAAIGAATAAIAAVLGGKAKDAAQVDAVPVVAVVPESEKTGENPAKEAYVDDDKYAEAPRKEELPPEDTYEEYDDVKESSELPAKKEELPAEDSYEEIEGEDQYNNDEYKNSYDEVYDSVEKGLYEVPEKAGFEEAETAELMDRSIEEALAASVAAELIDSSVEEALASSAAEGPSEEAETAELMDGSVEEALASAFAAGASGDTQEAVLSDAEKAIMAFDAEQNTGKDFITENDPFDYGSLESAFDDFLAGNISSDQLESLDDFAKTKVMSDALLSRLRNVQPIELDPNAPKELDPIVPTVMEDNGKVKMIQPKDIGTSGFDFSEEDAPDYYGSDGGFDYSADEEKVDEVAPWERPPVNGLEPAQEEIAIEELPYDPNYMLSDKLKRELAEFLLIEGMESEIGRVISTIATRKRTGDLSGGNLIVTGDPKSGKTYLTIAIIKAIGREIGTGNSKVAKVQADSLNGKNMDKVLTKIKGSDLIIENVGYLNDETIRDLIETLYTTRTDSMIVLEGNQLAVECILNNFPEITDLFRTRLTISELTLSQWADLACNYAEEQGYHVDDMALLALHRKIDEINVPTSRLGFNDIRTIVDKAISKAEKRNSGRFFRASKKAKGGVHELDESDFI